MLGLRPKIALAFGGVLAILLVVSVLSLWVLNRYSRTLDRFLYENYRSVDYAQNMKDAVDELDHAGDLALRGDFAESARSRTASVAAFEKNLQDEFNNVTLPGEAEAARMLRTEWNAYLVAHAKVVDPATPQVERERVYRSVLQDQARAVKERAQVIARMNLENMVKEDGEIKTTATNARTTMIVLMIAGSTMAVVFIAIVSRSLLQPLRSLTKSAREIERGNLDLVVKVRGRDEVGQLAEAFNAMAAKLREFRRTDRAKLVRTQRTTQLAVNSLPDAVAIIAADGKVELANPPARRFFGLQPDHDVAASSANGLLLDLYRRAATEGRPQTPQGYSSAIQVFDDGGVEKFFLPHAIPILEDGLPIGVTLVLADITNLRKLDEMKSGLLSVVSHELKTPLTSIRMATHLLLEERIGPLTTKQTELLLAAREDSDRLHRIIDNLLDMGRIESGRAALDARPIAPAKLIADAVEPMRSAFLDKGVEIDTAVLPDMPDVLADADRVGHVFTNLLSNALRFTPPGGTVSVSAEPSTDDGSVLFAVTDTGPGIPAEHIGRVFERFFRVPGQNGSTGAGLGLAIAKEIVDAHGGQIGVESNEGRGSRFNVTLRSASAVAAVETSKVES